MNKDFLHKNVVLTMLLLGGVRWKCSSLKLDCAIY